MFVLKLTSPFRRVSHNIHVLIDVSVPSSVNSCTIPSVIWPESLSFSRFPFCNSPYRV